MYLPRSLIAHLYNNLIKTHHPTSAPVVILSSLDPDAICACRILTALLKRDYIPHKIQPVSGYADLSKAGEDIIQPMKTTQGGSGGVVICLGVGGLVDLASLLGLEDDESIESLGGIEVWVLDARRPWNLSNVFGSHPETIPLQATDPNTNVPRRIPGVDKGCIQRSYRPGKGGIVVFDDGDIADELHAERHAYCELADMPEFDPKVDDEDEDDEDDDDDDDDENDHPDHDTSNSRKRKSWSDHENDDFDNSADEQPPRQRRRSNSGSSIASSQRNRTPPSSQPTSSPQPTLPKPPTAKQLRRKLLSLRRSHERVLEHYYSLGTSYSEPISSLVYTLASELGREDNDLLWLAIVGVTSLELNGQTYTGLGTIQAQSTTPSLPQYHQSWKATRSSRTYALLRDEVRRLNPPSTGLSPSISPTFAPASTTSSPSDSSIRLTPDPRFLLLRHWSLYDSMLHSPYISSRLHIWNDQGQKRLHKLLAKMGVSLTQCKQTYTHMDMDLKKALREQLLKYAGVYGLDGVIPVGSGRATYEQEGWSFVRTWGWKCQLNAMDVGVIVGAILDVGGTGHSPNLTSGYTGPATSTQTQAEKDGADVKDRSESLVPRFFAAYDALAPNQPSLLVSAIPKAQDLLRSIQRTGSALLAKHQIRHLRAFRMGVVKDGPDLGLFANSPGALVKLALWVGEAVCVQEKERGEGKRWGKSGGGGTPLVLAALDETRGTYVVVGTGGGLGSGMDIEARKEKDEKKAKRIKEKEEKLKAREAKRAAKAAEKAVRELDGEQSDEDSEEEDSESEDDDDDDSDDDDEAMKAQIEKRGYGHNRFGIAFQEVVEETSARVKIDSFDHCVVEVKKEDLAGFLEGLSLKSVVGR